MKIRSANGLECCLIFCADGQYRIRIYENSTERKFVDYDINHNDLFFRIVDEDAYLYEDDRGARIDHSPQTLGIQSDQSESST